MLHVFISLMTVIRNDTLWCVLKNCLFVLLCSLFRFFSTIASPPDLLHLRDAFSLRFDNHRTAPYGLYGVINGHTSSR